MDSRNPESTHDFGKDVIPLLLEEKEAVCLSVQGLLEGCRDS